MNDIDSFERELGRLLNQGVDRRVGPRRPAPRLDLSVAARRRPVRPWLMPVLAAAGVAAAVVAIVVPAHLVADRPAGGPGNGGGPNAPLSNPIPAPDSSDPNAPPPSPLPPADTVVDLGDASLRLPKGWVAREVTDVYQYGGSVYSREWCLAPAGSADPPRADCPLQFGSAMPVNGNVPSGTPLGGKFCPVSDLPDATGGGLVRFGQRDAFYREWHGHCADSAPWINRWTKQYVVDTAPGYVLFSDQMTPELDAAMLEIIEHASLPAQTGPLLLYDMGVVRTVTRQSDGYLMTIAPIFRMGGGWMPGSSVNRSYLIRPADLKYAVVGARVGVTTDGRRVIEVGPPISA
jgi:hypothetical protein